MGFVVRTIFGPIGNMEFSGTRAEDFAMLQITNDEDDDDNNEDPNDNVEDVVGLHENDTLRIYFVPFQGVNHNPLQCVVRKKSFGYGDLWDYFANKYPQGLESVVIAESLYDNSDNEDKNLLNYIEDINALKKTLRK
ncbi:hypothetical protein COEREDRAFT_89374 [Coemansia reversa NRRL 1564]|uniref:Uncharacterized protein n=1 Tax=Coemansia reversa (strain ATCC 12441 / NRRL 1564) TaxID=763665 RepID=A0A2G5B409_COERN|nr:hypothetical protein COEREDRAFT_89374 [Coemansia reversa NRRL 1564]|eukprot:PIA13739.1 hypothetical protein COEREDRAFT_89374 [Coemansia reversa NRRL 1564]